MSEEQKPVAEKTGFLEEEPGQTSSMRVMTFTVILTVLATYIVANAIMLIKAWKSGGALAMVDFSPYALTALLSALVAKGGQKVVENMDKIGDMVKKIKG